MWEEDAGRVKEYVRGHRTSVIPTGHGRRLSSDRAHIARVYAYSLEMANLQVYVYPTLRTKLAVTSMRSIVAVGTALQLGRAVA